MYRACALCVAFLLVVAAGMARAAPVVRTPGYTGVTKAVGTEAPTAPPAAQIGTGGSRPDIVVDAAGTAHMRGTRTARAPPTPRSTAGCPVARRRAT